MCVVCVLVWGSCVVLVCLSDYDVWLCLVLHFLACYLCLILWCVMFVLFLIVFLLFVRFGCFPPVCVGLCFVCLDVCFVVVRCVLFVVVLLCF